MSGQTPSRTLRLSYLHCLRCIRKLASDGKITFTAADFAFVDFEITFCSSQLHPSPSAYFNALGHLIRLLFKNPQDATTVVMMACKALRSSQLVTALQNIAAKLRVFSNCS